MYEYVYVYMCVYIYIYIYQQVGPRRVSFAQLRGPNDSVANLASSNHSGPPVSVTPQTVSNKQTHKKTTHTTLNKQ